MLLRAWGLLEASKNFPSEPFFVFGWFNEARPVRFSLALLICTSISQLLVPLSTHNTTFTRHISFGLARDV